MQTNQVHQDVLAMHEETTITLRTVLSRINKWLGIIPINFLGDDVLSTSVCHRYFFHLIKE